MMIAKVTFAVSIFLEADSCVHAERLIDNATLRRIANETDEGAWIAGPKKITAVLDRTHDIRDELLAIGNDGAFFDSNDVFDQA